ncbi:hypothetical protein Gura_3536 [Geotalea uraniireducens Rf4]|uniref:Uncharacterized protein n=1 Tax=Geotalea uraniireducens (strain Rf4) TaxID=351605 RepID=A5G7C3_GEOUR|nr:hypothetical protein Gura_3536 [Geotalea uraniireducens Rf4]
MSALRAAVPTRATLSRCAANGCCRKRLRLPFEKENTLRQNRFRCRPLSSRGGAFFVPAAPLLVPFAQPLVEHPAKSPGICILANPRYT